MLAEKIKREYEIKLSVWPENLMLCYDAHSYSLPSNTQSSKFFDKADVFVKKW